MIEIIDIEEVKNGDILLIDLGDKKQIITVEKCEHGLIVPVECGGLDFAPEDPGEIIRIGSKKEKPTIVVLSKSISLGLSSFWEDKFQK